MLKNAGTNYQDTGSRAVDLLTACVVARRLQPTAGMRPSSRLTASQNFSPRHLLLFMKWLQGTVILGRKSHSVQETNGRFERPISMNNNSRSNRFHGTGITRDQNTTNANAGATHLQRQYSGGRRPSPKFRPLLEPARGLQICLGWIRLFQSIVLPSYLVFARKGCRYEK